MYAKLFSKNEHDGTYLEFHHQHDWLHKVHKFMAKVHWPGSLASKRLSKNKVYGTWGTPDIDI